MRIFIGVSMLTMGCSAPDGDGENNLRGELTPQTESNPENGDCTGIVADAVVDNLVADTNEDCVLDGATVTGNLTVREGAHLIATNITVDGSLQADGAATVDLLGSVIEGNVQIAQAGTVALEAVEVDGNLSIEATSGLVSILDNQIAGNGELLRNLGEVVVAGNIIDGNLLCEGNEQAPTGSGNEASNHEGQCADL